MKYPEKINSPAARFLASTLIAGLAFACSESSNSDKTDDTLTPADSASTAQTAAPTTPVTNPTASTPSANPTTPSGNASNPTPTATNTGVKPTPSTMPLPDDTAVDPGNEEDEMGAGGAGSDDSTADEPSTEPDATEGDSSPEATDSDTTAPSTATDETDPDTTTPDTTDETDTTSAPGVPDAPQCAEVIKGELLDCAETSEADPNFSFFIASRVSMVALSDNPLGFGGNLGGLECADQICALIAECVAPANGQTWHAFLSTADVDAKDRIGVGPWYDVIGTKIADDESGLMGVERPTTADGVVNRNLPNEFGCENLTPACDDVKEDNHHVMTGSTPDGVLNEGRTCNDWTSTDATPGTGPAVGLSWERQLFSGGGGGGGGGGQNWLNFANESGCAPGGNLSNDPPMGNNDGTVGSGGGYGAIYCFAVVE